MFISNPAPAPVCMYVQSLSHVWLFEKPQTVAHQVPLSMGFSRQLTWILQVTYSWSKLPCPPPGHLPKPGIKPVFPASPALAGGFLTTAW